MEPLRVLFVSGSLGLGHVSRDVAIANEIRRLSPGASIDWLAGEPARGYLGRAGEHVLPEAEGVARETEIAEGASGLYSSSVFKYVVKAYDEMDRTAEVFEQVTAAGRYDVAVGDETYELWEPLVKRPDRLDCPFAIIYDFMGFDAMTRSPLERLGSYYFNRMWVNADRRIFGDGRNAAIFVGEPDDIPDLPLGPLLPNRRLHAKELYRFAGYVLTFDPVDYLDRERIRSDLGYDAPTIIVSVGGTAIGKALLELSARALPLIRREVPSARMTLVCGPRIEPNSLDLPNETDGLDVRGYVRELHEHFAACDLAIVQGGGTTTLELTALRRPFVYFPLQGHFEQQIAVAARLARHGAGTRMDFAEASPESLAATALLDMASEPGWPRIPADGAGRAAEDIVRLASAK